MDGLYIAIAIVIFGLLFDYTNGFHDAANVVSTVIATHVLSPRTAILISGLFNTLGAFWISGVAKTIASDIVIPHSSSALMVLGAVLGAICWNILTWYVSIPSSSSYALIGGLLGAALIHGGPEIILWFGVITKVILPMAISPFLGFFFAFAIMKGVRFLEKRYGKDELSHLFRTLQLCSASFMALAHGLNDAQKSMGVITLGLFSAGLIASIHIPAWVIISCAVVMGLGTASGGFRIIRTVGFKITKIRPSQGFAAETSSAIVILSASLFGMPVSSTQMVTGGITGVGAAKTMKSVQWKLIRRIVWTWVFTLPGAGFISALFYLLLKRFEVAL